MAKKTIAELQLKGSGGKQVAGQLDQVGKSTERLGRQQTRLGQASASAGRQFSAQASGLGGLVAAYAGAAATIFAITAAFQALNAAARAEQTITGVNALASAIGESGPKIIKGLQEITKGQLSIVQTAELANLALSSGFSADQINNLAEISLKASRALGRDLTDSFNRLVRGVTKLEPELLDELGIFTRLDPAVEKYARQLGKTVGSLSNFERRQAFANAVAEEGQSKFRDIDTSAETSAESLEKLSATLSDIGTKVGGFIARGLAPLAEALSNPIAAIGAFGILAKTVFGTTFREVGAGIERFEGRIESLSGTIVDKLGGSSRAAARANEALGASLSEVNLRSARVTSQFESEFKALVAKGRAQQLSFNETQRLNTITAQSIATLEKQKASLRASGLASKAKANQEKILTSRIAELNLALAATNTRLASTSKASLVAARGFTILASAAASAGQKLLSIFNAFTLIVTVASVFTTFGAIFLEAFGWLEPTIKLVESLVRKLRVLLGIQKEQLAQAKVAQELAKAARDVGDITLRSGFISDTVITGDQLQGGIAEALSQGATGSAQEFADAVIKDLPGALRTRITPQARAQIESIFTDLFGDIQGLGPEALQGISEFAEATGRTLKSVTNQLESSQGALRFEGAEKLPGYYGQVFATFKDTRTLEDEELEVAKQFNAAQVNRLQSQEILTNLQEALVSGAAEAEQIEKRRSAVIAKITNLKESENAADRAQVKALQETLNLLDQEAQAQLAILGERDKILKTFSTQIKASEKLADLFVLVGEGESLRAELAEDSNAKQRNRNKLLLEDFELGKQALARQRAGLEVAGRQGQLATLARDAQKAILGVFVQTVEEARKLAEQQEKISKELGNQQRAAENKLAVVQAERNLAIVRRQVDLKNKELDRVEKIRAAEAKLNKARIAGAEAQRKLGQELEKKLAEQGFQTDFQKRALELKFAREDVEALKAITQGQIADIQARAAGEEEKLRNQIAGLNKELGQGPQQEGGIAAVFRERERVEKEAINAQRQLKLDEIDLLSERKKGILEEGIEFQKHIQGIADVLAADVVARRELQEGDDFVKNTVDALRRSGDEQAAFMLERSGSVGDARRARVGLEQGPAAAEAKSTIEALTDRLAAVDFDKLKESTNAAFDAEEKLADTRLGIARNDEIDKAEQKLKDAVNALEVLGISTDAEIMAIENTLNAAITNLGIESRFTADQMDRLKAAQKQSFEIINGSLVGAFENLNTQLIDGTLTMDSVGQTFKDMMGNMLREVQSAVFKKTIAEPIAGSITSFLPALFNSGGPVHLAGGGTMKRDRVAAMLEPGEFVIRKEAAKKLGMSKLKDMNAGIKPDPLAMLIAQFGGSKVKGMATGGGPAGSAGQSGSGDHGGTSAAGPSDGGSATGMSPGRSMAEFGHIGFAGTTSNSTSSGSGGSSGRTTTSVTAAQVQAAMDRSRATGRTVGVVDAPDTQKGRQDLIDSIKSEQEKAERAATRGKRAGITVGKALALGIAGLTGPVGIGISAAIGGGLGLGDLGDAADAIGGMFAAGGPVHMAAGGAMKRDRVPALLEPGEFVIRKPMAKAIGGKALGAMNATGSVSPGNVSVNINNQGSPKGATVMPPRMNGDKMIIDVITRDLRNNGTLRKSLRGGNY